MITEPEDPVFRPLSPPPKTRTTWQDYTLEGILWSPDNPERSGALINDRTMGPGDRIGDMILREVLENYVIIEINGTTIVMINTTERIQTFQIPQSFLPLLRPGDPTEITIFDRKPTLAGDEADPSVTTSEIYLAIRIFGAIQLFDTLTLSGAIAIDISATSQSIKGVVTAQIEHIGGVSGQLDLIMVTNGAADPTGGGNLGIYGRVILVLTVGGSSEFEITGSLLLEINSYGEQITYPSFLTRVEATAQKPGELLSSNHVTDPTAGTALLAALDKDTNFPIIGVVTIGPDSPAPAPNLRIVIAGVIKLGPVVEIRGRFELAIGLAPNFFIEATIEAEVTLLSIGTFELDGFLGIYDNGIVVYGAI
ncbi:hypothetical protein IIC65_09730, partial [Candidatus Sumerlaeota bacterium]|nr:hypothetical protein [Candidatus Sumerlaeota bacterium]